MSNFYDGIPTMCITDEKELQRRHQQLPPTLYQLIYDLLERGLRLRDMQKSIAISELAVIMARGSLYTTQRCVRFFHANEEERSNISYGLCETIADSMLYPDDVNTAIRQARWLVEYEARTAEENAE